MERLLSFTEVETALTCWARWDFTYGGRLAGDALRIRDVAPPLYEGRAWGAAVAAWHAASGRLTALWDAHQTLRTALNEDAEQMAEAGFPLSTELRSNTMVRMAQLLDHYAMTTEPLPNLTRLERTTVVGVPSRGGKHASSRYKFLCRIDGYTAIDDLQWIVEFKLRSSLTPVPVIVKQRQPRWYAYGLTREQGGHGPTGVLVDERLNAVPGEPRVLASGKPSHDRRQRITPEAYIENCLELRVEPKPELIEHFRSFQWQQRVPIQFRPGEIDEAGTELRDAAKLIRDLDSGELSPIRNATPANCNRCRFRDICSEPGDVVYVDAQFERVAPKRLREAA